MDGTMKRPAFSARRRRRVGRLLALAALTLCLAATCGASGATAAPLPFAGVALHPWRFGGESPYPYLALEDPAQREHTFAMLQAAGVRTARVDLKWYRVQPNRFSLFDDWSDFDAIVAAATRHGITLLPMVAYPPAWANGGQGPWTFPSNPDDYGRFLAAAMQRYPQIPAWEIWNEPNLPQFSTPAPDPARFVALLRSAAEARAAAGSHALLISGGLAERGIRPFFDAMVSLGAFNYVDGFGIHPYDSRSPATPGSAFSQLPYFHQALQSIGRGYVGIWATEYGMPSNADRTSYGPGVGSYGAAQWLREAYTLAAGWPWLKNLTWYEFQDGCWRVSDPECHFGLVTLDFQPKPAYQALAAVQAGYLTRLPVFPGLPGVHVARRGQTVTVAGVVEAVEGLPGRTRATVWLYRARRLRHGGERLALSRKLPVALVGGRYRTVLRRLPAGRWVVKVSFGGTKRLLPVLSLGRDFGVRRTPVFDLPRARLLRR